ncbi:MAG: methyl-accepting chemotaxis protein [Ketobacteraceae bacterium]|nr:methyl-accepting chemotaxis protein [Ketobacteraceae bacterium]
MFKKSLSTRFSFIISVCIAVILIASGVFIATSLGERTSRLMVNNMDALLKGNQAKIELFNRELERTANQLSALFGEMFPGQFRVEGNELIQVKEQTVPAIYAGNLALAGNYSQVDRFAELTGGNATIFARRGNDFVRVVTSVKKEDGSRAVGTLLSRQSPAYRANIQGEPFTGKVTLFGRPFLTNYTPIVDRAGQVIGIRYIGIDFSDALAEISASLESTALGEAGHVFVIDRSEGDTRGRLVIHPLFAGEPVSDVIPRESVAMMFEQNSGQFSYRPAADSSGEARVARFVTIPELDWILVTSLPEAELNAAANWVLTMMVMVTVVLIVMVTLLLVVLSRAILGSPLDEMVDSMREMANGNYTNPVKVDREDEIGKLQLSLRQMQEQMCTMVSEILMTSTELAGAASQLSASSRQVADGSTQQSQAATTMASTIEELTVSIDRLSENAQEARSVSSASNERAHKGAEVIRQAGNEMHSINRTVTEAADEIRELGNLSGQISSIIQTIQEIADQTNLLALNAAIEAARAGEQGRGFAVVADEVRGLAARTSTSAQEITATIDKIQERTHRSVETMESGVEQVEKGASLSSQAGEAIQEISAGSQRVVEVFSDISDMLREQAQASTDIARNVEDIAQMAEQNSTSVTQVASAADQLSGMAADLKSMISRFRIAGQVQPGNGSRAGSL